MAAIFKFDAHHQPHSLRSAPTVTRPEFTAARPKLFAAWTIGADGVLSQSWRVLCTDREDARDRARPRSIGLRALQHSGNVNAV